MGQELSRWCWVVDPPGEGAWNMARDHALARRARRGVGLPDSLSGGLAVLRFYRWARPTVSLGRHEAARARVDRDRLLELGIDCVRRPTGGRAILHHHELTYSITAPLTELGGPRSAFDRIQRALARGLRTLGVEVTQAGADAVGGRLHPDAGPCFREPAAGELIVKAGKAVGSAQARIEGALLQHGSILVDNDQGILSEVGLGPAGGGGAGGVGLSEVLGRRPGNEELVDHLLEAFRAEMGGVWSPLPATEETLPSELLEHYRSDTWTWRR